MKGEQMVSRNLSSVKQAVITQTWDVILLGFINSSVLEPLITLFFWIQAGRAALCSPYKTCVSRD